MAFIVLFFCIPKLSLENYRHFTQNPVAGEHLRMQVLGWINQNTSPQSRVVLGDSGLIPWRSDARFLDSWCLNNVEMTRYSPKKRYEQFCEDILKVKPEVVILTALIEKGETIYSPADKCLAPRLKTHADYQLQASLRTGNKQGFYRYEIYQIKREV
jgi:hypothetical protein